MSILHSPCKVGKVKVRNRLVMPPMATSKATKEGFVTKEVCEYYDEKTRDGAIGLVITEHSFVSVEGKASEGQLSIACDDDIAGLKELTSIIHNHHTSVIAQLNHAGGKAKTSITGEKVFGASAVPLPKTNVIPKEMNISDLQKVIQDFTNAADRAKKAGFDGIELHSAHGYLLNQFYSPLTNKRTDEYSGQTLCGRLKLHIEMIRSIRSVVGADYPIALRLGACDYMEGGSTIEDGIEAANMLEEAGIDLLDISGGFCGYMRPDTQEQGYFSEITKAIKETVNIPVVLTGGIIDVHVAEQLLKEGKADFIGVGRAILKDSSWAKTAMATIDSSLCSSFHSC